MKFWTIILLIIAAIILGFGFGVVQNILGLNVFSGGVSSSDAVILGGLG